MCFISITTIVVYCILTGSFTSDDAKSVRELKELLSNNMTARSKAESDKMVSHTHHH